ncbi:MAG: excinuclease ABC subunit UvrA [Bacteroidetes bacterium]|nr:excinuclease ABC subunit UvrA [Bacteroidota bacterium]
MKFSPDLDPKKYIIIKGAAVHNLKKVDVAIPRNHFVVITGLSGSGKSSLAFDTLYAEGQRRYVESLSSYARQFIGRMDKPEVEYIKGIAPAIAIEQKVNVRNPRSTVGTTTEIYDYLKLLFARIGTTISPVSGVEVKKNTVSDIVDFSKKLAANSKVMLFFPLTAMKDRSHKDELNILLQKGFTRVKIKEDVVKIEDLLDQISTKKPIKGKSKTTDENNSFQVLVDRFITEKEGSDESEARIADSAQTAFYEGHGTCICEWETPTGKKGSIAFSNRFEADGILFEEPSTLLFSFNNPFGACRKCEGFGSVIGIDEDLVIPDKSISVFDGAIVAWRGEKMKEWNDALIKVANKFDFPIHRPIYELNQLDRQLLWSGNKYFKGLNEFFKHIEEQSYKIQYRVMLSRYRGKTTCPDCLGSRLRKDANYVKIGGKSITELVLMPVTEGLDFFRKLKLNNHQQKIASRILIEVVNRLTFLDDVGLGYLTLNRLSNTLSGGESQRINLATSLGSSLVGSMYILDEPSIGLHSRDTERLIKVLKSLQIMGNTLIVVEHDEDIMKAADQLIDIGPMAGSLGGELVFQGTFNEMMRDSKSLTAQYLNHQMEIPVPDRRRRWKQYIEILGARENNLKNVNVKFPLGVLTVVTGVSGSGKTSLVKKILYPALKKMSGGYGEQTGNFDRIAGDFNSITDAEMVDQNPIGKSSRSNPVTYVKAYDEIRALFSEMPLAKNRNLKPSHFSFNVDGGRCDACQGEGYLTIEMQFMADIHLKCEACGGKRFKEEILAIEFNEKNIDDILQMTVDDALLFFGSPVKTKYSNQLDKIVTKLKPLADVGLGYVRLGQSSNTLSGGEAQRIKLASFISKGNSASSTLFVFDEPTTGLHFHDINKLMDAFNALLKQGNTIIVIEHNMEIIKCADWVIDLGPDGGNQGGHLVFEGTPEDMVKCKESITGGYLKEKLKKR